MKSCWVLVWAAAALPGADSLIDRHIEAKARQAAAAVAPLSSDAEFLRRVTLDLTGRLPTPKEARTFLANPDPAKRQQWIDSLFPPLPVAGMRSLKEHPFLDRWAYYFNDLFRNGQLLEEGINTFYDYIYKALMLNVPYDEFVRELITASALSTWADGPSNFVARSHVFEGDGYQINHEDTADEIAINTSRLFLGVSLECISCHDGRAHLEKVNLFLSQRKRAETWGQAAFFGRTLISPAYGRTPQFLVKDKASGYSLGTRSSMRPARAGKGFVQPVFFLGGGTPAAGESPREAYARLLTGHPQFARATVNLFWTELMGRGIVDPPFDFDLARQDPRNPPPAPWTLQPSHPELLDELAAAFAAHGYDLRWLIREIVSSRAYQRSSAAPAGWKDNQESLFTRRVVRRLPAEWLWDAIGDLTGQHKSWTVTFSNKKFGRLLEARSPQDIAKTDKPLLTVLQHFGQCDRYNTQPDRRPGMIQAAILLNDKQVLTRIQQKADSALVARFAKDPAAALDEFFWLALSRPPTPAERELAMPLAARGREGVEDLLWAFVNRLDFLFY